jgi:O-antigen/teichoic acid export membrane protein
LVALSENSERFTSRFSVAELSARLRTWLTDHSDRSLAQRVASTAFLIRVASAALAYFSQAILARWMGSFEFGIFVYVWTWVMVIGGMVDLGLCSSAQRFIPDYAENGTIARLRGFLSGSRWIAFAVATAAALLGAAGVKLLDQWLDDYTIIPLYIACLTLPIYGVMHVQDGIARSYNWINVAMLPPYIARQIIVIALMGAAYLLGYATDATTGIAAAAISVWIAGLSQMLLLNRRLDKEVGPGAKSYELPRWIRISLPMFIVNGFYLMLLYVDILILKQFRSPDEIAIYYAAAKTMSLVTFV